MKYTYDEVVDAVFLYLVETIEHGQVVRSALVPVALSRAAVTVALDSEGRALGLEFLGASQIFTSEALEALRRGRTPFDELA